MSKKTMKIKQLKKQKTKKTQKTKQEKNAPPEGGLRCSNIFSFDRSFF